MNTSPNNSKSELVAAGLLGDKIYWEDDFSAIEYAVGLLAYLEELEHEADWQFLLKDLDRLTVIQSLDTPPFYNCEDFENVRGFTVDTRMPENDLVPGNSFYSIEVYLDASEKKATIEQFVELANRLECYDPLKPFIYV